MRLHPNCSEWDERLDEDDYEEEYLKVDKNRKPLKKPKIELKKGRCPICNKKCSGMLCRKCYNKMRRKGIC